MCWPGWLGGGCTVSTAGRWYATSSGPGTLIRVWPSHEWLADALLQHVPEGGYPPVASGVLDADTAWTHLLTQYLGLHSGRPDAVMLVAWSTVGAEPAAV